MYVGLAKESRIAGTLRLFLLLLPDEDEVSTTTTSTSQRGGRERKTMNALLAPQCRGFQGYKLPSRVQLLKTANPE